MKKLLALVVIAVVLISYPIGVEAWTGDGGGDIIVSGPPTPQITSVTFDKASYIWGEWIQISVTAKNNGITAEMYLSISLPNNPDAGRIAIVSGFNDPGIHMPPKVVKSNYGQSTVALSYPLIEDYLTSWPAGESRTLTIKVRPQVVGTFTFYVKSVGQGGGQWKYDPTTGTKDQQNEYVYVYTRQVTVNVNVGSFAVTLNPGQTKDGTFRVTNNNFDSITATSFSVISNGGFDSSKGTLSLVTALPQTIAAQSYMDFTIRAQAYSSCPSGTYRITYRMQGNP